MRDQVLVWALGELNLMNFSLIPIVNPSLCPMLNEVQTWALVLVEVDLLLTSH